MTITAEEAKKIVCKVEEARAIVTIEKAEAVLSKIEQEIREAAQSGLRENHIGLRSYMLNSDFPDLNMAKRYIAASVRKNGFTVTWDSNCNFVLIVKW